MKIIPINNGNYLYKSLNNEIFKSRYSEVLYGNIHDHKNTDILSYDNKIYVVGEGDYSLEPDKSNDFLTKICIVNMLCRFCEDVEHFKILLTTPPLYYQKMKDSLPKFIKGIYRVTHNDNNKIIFIDDAVVYPETLTAFLANDPVYYKDKILIVIDIGGLTTNGVLIKNGTYSGREEDRFTIFNGMYHLDEKLAQYFNSIYFTNVDVDDMWYYRENGLFSKNNPKLNLFDFEKEYILNLYSSHIKRILRECQLKKWNIDSYEVLVTGGGGKTLFSAIKNNFIQRAQLSVNPVFDNLLGLEKLAKAVFKEDANNNSYKR